MYTSILHMCAAYVCLKMAWPMEKYLISVIFNKGNEIGKCSLCEKERKPTEEHVIHARCTDGKQP